MNDFKTNLKTQVKRMTPSIRVLPALLLTAVLATTLPGCGYNKLQAKDEAVNAGWSEVLNQYQRRADLVPNLVNVVKGYASHESQVLTEVTQARAQVGSMQITPELVNDPVAFKKFQDAQGQLTSALSRLLVVTENYPNLKADAAFRDLSAQLEGTENRITVARNRYITTVQDYNTYVRQLPQSITAKIIGMQPKPNFSVANEAQVSTAPNVSFDTGTNNQLPNQNQNYRQNQQSNYGNSNTVNNPYTNTDSNSTNNTNSAQATAQ